MLRIKKGINLGGWLSQCEYNYSHYDSFITKNDFLKIRDYGFDHIRLPIDYNVILNDDDTFNEKGFDYINNAVFWCKENNLAIVLDLHKTKGYFFGNVDNNFFENKDSQNIFYKIWQELAIRYSNQEHVYFELLNEVVNKDDITSWNSIATNCIRKIREISNNVPIIVGSYWYNHVKTLSDLDVPIDENIIFSFHFYEPHIFTHQGAFWMPKMDPDFRTKFILSYGEYDQLTKKYIGEEGHDFKDFYFNDKMSLEYFELQIEQTIKVSQEKNVQLYCGEYGVIDRANIDEAKKWFSMTQKIFDKYNISRALWTYKDYNFELKEDFLPFI